MSDVVLKGDGHVIIATERLMYLRMDALDVYDDLGAGWAVKVAHGDELLDGVVSRIFPNGDILVRVRRD